MADSLGFSSYVHNHIRLQSLANVQVTDASETIDVNNQHEGAL